MLIYYLLTTGKENFVEKLIEKDFTTINLYSEILYNFNDLIKHLELKTWDILARNVMILMFIFLRQQQSYALRDIHILQKQFV
jgi:hypothetical protein